ncbi:MAG: hypothetical protein ACOCZL_04900, partial [Bacteroidota bacterium]
GILPYVIAAGFYLVYILFSFAQPFIQKTFSKAKPSEEKTISINEPAPKISEDKNYHFEEHSVYDSFTKPNPEYSFHIKKYIDQISPPVLCFYSHQLSFSLFSRPPPAC